MENQSMLLNAGKPIERKKGDFLLRQGEINSSIYVVTEGLLKAYYSTTDGKEWIKSFIKPGEFIGSLIACHTNEPSTFNLVCLQDSALRRIPFVELRRAATSSIDTAEGIINSLIQLAIKKERREFEFLCLSAPERFALLRERDPDLIEKLTQNDIARYLGITPVALSRIKQRQSL